MKTQNKQIEAKKVIAGLDKRYFQAASFVQLTLSDAHGISLPLDLIKSLIAEVQNELN